MRGKKKSNRQKVVISDDISRVVEIDLIADMLPDYVCCDGKYYERSEFAAIIDDKFVFEYKYVKCITNSRATVFYTDSKLSDPTNQSIGADEFLQALDDL